MSHTKNEDPFCDLFADYARVNENMASRGVMLMASAVQMKLRPPFVFTCKDHAIAANIWMFMSPSADAPHYTHWLLSYLHLVYIKRHLKITFPAPLRIIKGTS